MSSVPPTLTKNSKARLKSLRRSFSHTFRSDELELFNRLLLRNQAQHRGTRYLRLLCCCRNARKRIDRLPLWPYVIDGNTEQLDLNVLRSLVSEYEQERLRFCAVAQKAGKELRKMIAHSFFLPFCVASWSCISRLYTIELKLRADVSNVISSMQAFTALPGTQEEDLGEVVARNVIRTTSTDSAAEGRATLQIGSSVAQTSTTSRSVPEKDPEEGTPKESSPRIAVRKRDASGEPRSKQGGLDQSPAAPEPKPTLLNTPSGANTHAAGLPAGLAHESEEVKSKSAVRGQIDHDHLAALKPVTKKKKKLKKKRDRSGGGEIDDIFGSLRD